MNATKFIAACAINTMASAVLLGIFTLQAGAQQMYRIVGPDGKVTFSDTPPPASAKGKVTTGRAGQLPGDAAASTGNMPLELRTVVTKYPVTLYTSKGCVPCNVGRNMLQTRGIPFNEKTVDTQLDAEAFKRLSGENSLPMAVVGNQQLKGYSDQEWGQYLDAAGYPKTSVLPNNYRRPAPSPMVMVVEAPAAPKVEAPVPSAAAPAPAPANPAGIKF